MKIICITALLCCALSFAQPPRLELTPGGFDVVAVALPAAPAEKLIDLTKVWAFEFNRKEDGFDITNVTANSITISAFKDNAFFYRERGQAFDHKIRYTMEITFNDAGYTVDFKIPEIYSDDRLIEYTIPDYFTREGKLKEGYGAIERSLEASVNNIVKSHYNFLANSAR